MIYNNSYPRKGYQIIGWEDLEEAEHICQMCGQEHIRYVCTVKHSETGLTLEVGETCASNLTENYKGARKAITLAKSQKELKTRVSSMDWRLSKKGNFYAKITFDKIEYLCIIFEINKKYKLSINNIIGTKIYDTKEIAIDSIADGIIYLHKKNIFS